MSRSFKILIPFVDHLPAHVVPKVSCGEQVPVVDLAEPDEVAARKMRAACEDYGFLYGKLFLRSAPDFDLVT